MPVNSDMSFLLTFFAVMSGSVCASIVSAFISMVLTAVGSAAKREADLMALKNTARD